MNEKRFKKIFVFVLVSLVVIPLFLGVFCMITGTVDSFSGKPDTLIESFLIGSTLVYFFYCWPYIIISLLYILIYSIRYRKTEFIKKIWRIIGIIVLIFFIIAISPLGLIFVKK